MRSITISTDVYAQIWSNRHDGEETEDQILRRILGLPEREAKTEQREKGINDLKNGVYFPEGFTVTKTYKGRKLEASVQNGQWYSPTAQKSYPSLGKLTSASADSSVNSWVFWEYVDKDGVKKQLTTLRPLSKS